MEDEYHVLCVCERYNDILSTLYNKALSTFNEFHNLPELNKLTIYKETSLSFFLSLNKRRNYMYVALVFVLCCAVLCCAVTLCFVISWHVMSCHVMLHCLGLVVL